MRSILARTSTHCKKAHSAAESAAEHFSHLGTFVVLNLLQCVADTVQCISWLADFCLCIKLDVFLLSRRQKHCDDGGCGILWRMCFNCIGAS